MHPSRWWTLVFPSVLGEGVLSYPQLNSCMLHWHQIKLCQQFPIILGMNFQKLNCKWRVQWRANNKHKRKTRKNCFRHLKLMSPLNVAICTTISYTLWVEWYYSKNDYLTLRSKSHEGHCGTWHTALWSCTQIPNIIDLSRKTKMVWLGQENTI